jgi:hypothetical protein
VSVWQRRSDRAVTAPLGAHVAAFIDNVGNLEQLKTHGG